MPSPPPWYHPVTIDLLVHVLRKSILHPFIACLVPVSLRAIAHPADSPLYIASCVWAALVIACHLLQKLNLRVAYGAPREVDWDHEVVVITGGGSGLGRVLAETWGMRGASVAVLDVREPTDQLAGCTFYQCDVGDAQAVEGVAARIMEDLGPPTILINNAALTPHPQPLLNLPPTHINRTLTTNLHAPFHTLQTFLPHLLASPTGAHVITISSVLAKLGASHLSAYTASKAGLLAMHRSLEAELRSPTAPSGSSRVKTILVAPGQLGTAMFAGTATPSGFLGPVVEATEIAREVVRLVDEGRGGEVAMPLYARWIEWMGVLPVGVQRVARRVAGVDAAMEVGRKDV